MVMDFRKFPGIDVGVVDSSNVVGEVVVVVAVAVGIQVCCEVRNSGWGLDSMEGRVGSGIYASGGWEFGWNYYKKIRGWNSQKRNILSLCTLANS